jgi:hypothetical protein
MFVRFRAVRHRLVVNLVETRRGNGGVRSEHIARLGSVALPEPPSMRERIRFWRELKDRFRDIALRLANRVSADDRRKALAAIHARIPKPTEQDIKVEREHDDIALLERMRKGCSEHEAETTKHKESIIASFDEDIAWDRAFASDADGLLTRAQTRLLKLLRGEEPPGDGDPVRELADAYGKLLAERSGLTAIVAHHRALREGLPCGCPACRFRTR